MKINEDSASITFLASSHPSCCNILAENAPPERQVSPEKLYRAALLRSRFADTIIKAQEKTLEKVRITNVCLFPFTSWYSTFNVVRIVDQGEKLDPEKLRTEREELERRRREGI